MENCCIRYDTAVELKLSCCTCFESIIITCLLNCGHEMCLNCSLLLHKEKCPLCREDITTRQYSGGSEIFVKYNIGIKSLSLNVDLETTTIYQIKQLIYLLWGQPVNLMHLIYKKQLQNDKTCQYYDIQPLSTIQIVSRMRGD